MQVKCIHVCRQCDHPVEESIQPFNELEFKDRCRDQPEDYTLEVGPGYQGICFLYDKDCTQCT